MNLHFIFPKPRDWDTFEDIVCDVFARRYQNQNLQRYGRSGQGQQGVDIAGLTKIGVIGVQCKHHVRGDLKIREITKEVVKAETFNPKLAQYIIATSAERDTKAHAHVLALTEQRSLAHKFSVSIMFWEDICSWLVMYPDLVYKHFTKFFPIQELVHVQLSALRQLPRGAVEWPCTREDVMEETNKTLGSIHKVDPYQLSIGFTTFQDTSFSEPVDLIIPISNLLGTGTLDEVEFRQAAELLKQVRTTISDPYFDKNIVVQINARLAYAFLFGWIFRKVSGFSLSVIAGQEVWPSSGLVFTPSQLSEDIPILHDSLSNEVVLVLNIIRHIQPSVIDEINRWAVQPKAVVSYRFEGGVINSAAQAMMLALEIARKVKNLIDIWGVRKIHLFSALPAALAILIGHHLNAICPIDLYYLDETRSRYILAGTLYNSL